MAALTFGHCCCSKRVPSSEPKRNRPSRNLIILSCQGRTPDPDQDQEKKQMQGEGKLKLLKLKLLNEIEKRMSPQQKQKGDWKDLLLMSISFAVYVYISQMLVCAYFAWTSVPKPIW